MDFFFGVWFCFFVCAFGSTMICFAKKWHFFILGNLFFLSGIAQSFFLVDSLTDSRQGLWIVLFVFLAMSFFLFCFVFLQKKTLKNFLYPLPFLAFICLAMANNLLMVLWGLVLFSVSFLLQARFKENPHLTNSVKTIQVGLCCFIYGMSLIFLRLNSLALSQIYYKTNDYNPELILSNGLLFLGVMIIFYGVFPLLKVRQK